jgi:hypothetical protein
VNCKIEVNQIELSPDTELLRISQQDVCRLQIEMRDTCVVHSRDCRYEHSRHDHEFSCANRIGFSDLNALEVGIEVNTPLNEGIQLQ